MRRTFMLHHRYRRPSGYVAGYLTGLNDSRAFCGTGYSANSYRTLLRGSSLSATPESVPFPAARSGRLPLRRRLQESDR